MKNNIRTIFWIALALLLCLRPYAQSQSPISTWTDVNGKSLQARFISLEDQTVTLHRPDGRMIKLPIHRLNDDCIAKAQALATPGQEPAAPGEDAKPAEAAGPAVHGTGEGDIAVLKATDVSLTVNKKGDAFFACAGGETFPLELAPRVYVTKNGGKERVNGKPAGAAKVGERDVVIPMQFGPDIEMELHYELDLKGQCIVWYRFKNNGELKTHPQVRVGFPTLIGVDVETKKFARNRTGELLSESELRSWIGRKTVKMSSFKGYGSDKMGYTKPVARDTSGTFKSLSVDRGVYHDKAIEVDAPKSRDTFLQIFMTGGSAPMNGYSFRLVNQASWEKTNSSTGMIIAYK